MFIEQGGSSTTIGECIYAALMPLIAVVEVLVFAVAGCFNSHPPLSIFRNRKSAYTSNDFARLAEETRCNVTHSFYFLFQFCCSIESK